MEETQSPGELEIASVLIMDLVAYSRQQMERQREMVEQLEKAVRESPAVQRASIGGGLIRIPTGDGIALVFFHDPTASAQSAVEITRAIRESKLQLRIGLHAGPVYRVTDINANRNVSGGGINVAQRVMDCGDAGHILVSSTMAEMLNQVGNWGEYLHDLGEGEVKHGVRVRLFNLCAPDAGNPSQPAKFRAATAGKRAFKGLLRRWAATRWQMRIACLLALLVAVAAAVWVLVHAPGGRPSAAALSWYTDGLKSMREGTYYRASKALERAAALSPGYPLVHARLAEAWNELDSPQRAGEAMLRANMLGTKALARKDRLVLQAIHKTLIYDFSGAVQDYEKMLRLAPDAEQYGAYVDLGRAHEKNNSPQKAIESYQQAAQRAPQNAGAFLHLAILYARRQDRARATENFDAATKIYEASSNLEGLTEVLYQRGDSAMQRGESEEARQLLERALGYARTTGNVHQQVRGLLKLSGVAYNTGNFALSERRATEAIQLARDGGVDNLTARAVVDLGTTFFMRRDFERARQYFQQGLASAERYENHRTEAAALYSLGNVDILKHEIEQGVRRVEQALAFYRQNGFDAQAAQCLILIGRVQRDRGNYTEALKNFGDQLELAKRTADRSLAARAHESLGSVLLQQERYPEALAHFQENYAAVDSMKDPSRLAVAALQQARALWPLGKYQEASKLLDSIARSNGDSPVPYSVTASIDRIRAQMALSRQSYAEAIAWARKSAAMAGGDPSESAELGRIVCLAQVRSNAVRQGLDGCRQAVGAAQEAGDPKLLSTVRLALAEAQMRAGDTAAAQSAIGEQLKELERLGCTESLWRAWLLSAEAARLSRDDIGAKTAVAGGRIALEKIRGTWNNEVFTSYTHRPDVAQVIANFQVLRLN